MRLHLTAAAAEKLSACRLTEEELSDMIRDREEQRLYVLSEETGRRFCHQTLGYITCWAEYMPDGAGGYTVCDVYCHRLRVRETDGKEET